MAAQELCSSKHQDIVDVATVEGVSRCQPVGARMLIEAGCAGPVVVTAMMNDNMQQSPVVDYFYRSRQFPTHLKFRTDIKWTFRYFWDAETLSLRVSPFYRT